MCWHSGVGSPWTCLYSYRPHLPDLQHGFDCGHQSVCKKRGGAKVEEIQCDVPFCGFLRGSRCCPDISYVRWAVASSSRSHASDDGGGTEVCGSASSWTSICEHGLCHVWALCWTWRHANTTGRASLLVSSFECLLRLATLCCHSMGSVRCCLGNSRRADNQLLRLFRFDAAERAPSTAKFRRLPAILRGSEASIFNIPSCLLHCGVCPINVRVHVRLCEQHTALADDSCI
mmetsp:Transcript_129727/g.307752  ORF Transcript_129727/g.307752 Transcript_129727/m.307752 type:complete len:231 (-) Transcript_129727:311-1003(-)